MPKVPAYVLPTLKSIRELARDIAAFMVFYAVVLLLVKPALLTFPLYYVTQVFQGQTLDMWWAYWDTVAFDHQVALAISIPVFIFKKPLTQGLRYLLGKLLQPFQVLKRIRQQGAFVQIVSLMSMFAGLSTIALLVGVLAGLWYLTLVRPDATAVCLLYLTQVIRTFEPNAWLYMEPIFGSHHLIAILVGGIAAFMGVYVSICWCLDRFGFQDEFDHLDVVTLWKNFRASTWYKRYCTNLPWDQAETLIIIPSIATAASLFITVFSTLLWVTLYNPAPLTNLIYKTTTSLQTWTWSNITDTIGAFGLLFPASLLFAYVVLLITMLPLFGFWWECARLWSKSGIKVSLPPWEVRWWGYCKSGLHVSVYFLVSLPIALLLAPLTRGRSVILCIHAWLKARNDSEIEHIFKAIPGLVKQYYNPNQITMRKTYHYSVNLILVTLLGILLTSWSLILPIVIVQGAMILQILMLIDEHTPKAPSVAPAEKALNH